MQKSETRKMNECLTETVFSFIFCSSFLFFVFKPRATGILCFFNWFIYASGKTKVTGLTVHRRKMSAHALLKMTRDLFRAMSLGLRQKCPGNVVEMKGAMAAMAAFFGSDSVASSCHCKR